MKKIDHIDAFADVIDTDLLLLGGTQEERKRFESAIIGIAYRFGMEPSVCYDRDRGIEIFAEDMGLDDAIEWFKRNLMGKWMGESTPVFIEVL